MTYYQVGQRGGQPLYSASKTSIRKGTGKPAQAGRCEEPKNRVQFGGGFGKKAIDGSVSIFQKINEVFIWGFLAQDVIGMWLPRVGTSLKVGREPYDPSEDPQARNLPFDQQVKKWIVGNVKGLNWINFSEGTKRESATGPGLLAMPALVFMVNRYMGNPAQELSFASMKALGEGFQKHLQQQQQKIANVQDYKKAVQGYVRGMFVDPDLKGLKIGQQTLDQWCHEWTETAFAETEKNAWERVKDNFRKDKGPAQKLGDMAEALHKEIRAFNREHRAIKYTGPKGHSPLAHLIADDAPLHHADQVWTSYHPQAASPKVALRPVGAVTEELKRFGWYARKVWDNHEAKQSGCAVLSEAVEKTMKGMVVRKFMLGMGTTVLSAYYLTRLAFWAQNHGTYQAVRQFREDKANKHKGHSHGDSQQAAAQLFAPQSAFSATMPGLGLVRNTNPMMPSAASGLPMNPSVAAFRGQPAAAPVDWRRG